MSIINCPECGNKISDNAESCPHCGFGSNSKGKSVGSLGSVIKISNEIPRVSPDPKMNPVA